MQLSFQALCVLCAHQIVVLWYILHGCLPFDLDGSVGSYAKFPSWEPCLNWSFSFEFKTSKTNALLVYFDRGSFNFFELKIIGGSARLRLTVRESTVTMHAGEKLDDSKWHKVQVQQDNRRTILTVDGVPHSKTPPNGWAELSEVPAGTPFLFIGGLPKETTDNYLRLALPSIVFEPRFQGSIRNLFYRDCDGEEHRPAMIDSHGILSTDVDYCEKGNPCLNGGTCLSTDGGLICDCTRTDFTGVRCDIGEYTFT